MDAGYVLSSDNTMDPGFEAHVKHAGGLVGDKVTDVGQADTTALNEINETSGSGAQRSWPHSI